ncbi:MAG TPA: UDP-N-acetylmuramoyl-tripeptide--D-alanyl-D-alanine ligase [Ignavibacteriaceae bacterium]|nr:UDP-N-acetylmuramoyl-tripeptide--D-alanyl-D-alanine ligase [Ignavibacteriaceae bacterium]
MKRIGLTIKDLFDLDSAVIYNPDDIKTIRNVSIDSRNISNDCLFIALKGDRFDGHDFIGDAVANGAIALLIDRKKLSNVKDYDIPVITVDDPIIALGNLARCWRKKLSTKIIGITGSIGKTSTKEMVAMLLSTKYRVNKTIANYNNHIGVPLTLFSTNEKHDVLVAELGTNHFGEIEYTANIAMPDYAMITNIGESHLEFFLNKKGILKEKSAVFQVTAKMDGTLFVNNDDRLIKEEAKKYKKKITYGFNSDSAVRGEVIGYSVDGRPEIEITYKKNKLKVDIPTYGEANAKNFLAAAAVAFTLGLSVKEISKGLQKLGSIEKRLNVKRKKDFILIDDTYNASPSSMKEAMNLAGRIKIHRKKIAILGDMFELGEKGPELHRKLAASIKLNKFDSVYLTGSLMKNLYEELKKSNVETKYFNNRKRLNTFLYKQNFSDSVILVKGSRGMKMEEFVKTIEEKTGK